MYGSVRNFQQVRLFRPGVNKRFWRRGNGFEPPSRAFHTRALPIELPCQLWTCCAGLGRGAAFITSSADAHPLRKNITSREALLTFEDAHRGAIKELVNCSHQPQQGDYNLRSGAAPVFSRHTHLSGRGDMSVHVLLIFLRSCGGGPPRRNGFFSECSAMVSQSAARLTRAS